MGEILHKDLCYLLNGLAFKVHNKLGRFCREKQYADEFEKLLAEEKIKFEREYDLQKINADSPSGNRVDFYIEGKILVEFKAKQIVTKDDFAQIKRYLRAADKDLGIIYNFRCKYIKGIRVLNSDQSEYVKPENRFLNKYSEHSDVHSDDSERT